MIGTNVISRRFAACLGLAALFPLLAACTGLEHRMAELQPKYAALPGHKAMVFNEDNDRLVWVSGKGSQLDAIQLAEILCSRASMNPDECKLVSVDDHRLYDPVREEAYPPDSPELADILYEAGISAKTPKDDESSCFLGLFC